MIDKVNYISDRSYFSPLTYKPRLTAASDNRFKLRNIDNMGGAFFGNNVLKFLSFYNSSHVEKPIWKRTCIKITMFRKKKLGMQTITAKALMRRQSWTRLPVQDMFPRPGTKPDRPGNKMVKARKMEKKWICFHQLYIIRPILTGA